jgi:putative membrane protein insertion efficiency factor
MSRETAPCPHDATNAEMRPLSCDSAAAALITSESSATGSRRYCKVIDCALQLPGKIAIFLVRMYQYFLSPWLGQNCRFHPTCSQYFIVAVTKYGILKALWKGTSRICRCHPWNPGGYDPP